MTRAEANATNRRAILDAAEVQFQELGYHGASLDGIAEAAGFSKGAVYSRFDSKDDLFLAVVEDRINRRERKLAEQLAESDGPVEVQEMALAALRANVDSIAWQAALLEFRAHAWRDPDINRRYADLHRRTIRLLGALIADVYRRRGEAPPYDVELLAVVGLAEGTGVVAELMCDPDLDLPAVVTAMVDRMAQADRSI